MSEKAKLFLKMTRVMGRLDRIEKRGKNQFFNYEFVTSDDVLDAVRKAMSAEGLALYVSMLGTSVVETGGLDKQGKPKVKHVTDFEFTFADSETGETLPCIWRGEALDNEDKALSKCATSAEKYFLLKTFLIGTGDEPDPDEGDENGQRAAVKKPAQKPAPAQEPTLPTMSLESAQAVTTSEGVAYGTMDAARLSNMAKAIVKKLAGDLTQEDRETYEFKLSAIRTIQAANK